MANRRQLLVLAGGLAVWVGAFRLVPQIAAQLDGFEFSPLQQVPGFRTLSSSARTSSPGSGSFDFMSGLMPVEPLPAGLMQQVKAAPERYLFKAMDVGRSTTPVAYFFDYYCTYCRVLSAHLTELAAASEIVVDALAQMRLWLPGKFFASVAASEQVGLEHFRRCSEAEALARRGVQASTEGAQFFLRQAVRIGVAA